MVDLLPGVSLRRIYDHQFDHISSQLNSGFSEITSYAIGHRLL